MGSCLLSINRMKNIIYFCLFISSLTTIISCNNGENNKQSASQKSSFPVEAYKVTAQPFNNELVTTASLMANEQVTLTAPLPGQVMEIYFKEGEKIKKGERIIRIDDRQWKAQLTGVRAELDAAKKDYKRKKELLNIEGASQEEVDKAFATIQTLKSQLQQLQINIDLATVSAPFSGQLGMRNFSKGSFLKQGDNITTLTDVNPLKVNFELAQTHLKNIEERNSVQVLTDGDTLEATIYAINPLINEQTGTVSIRALLKQPEDKVIMPGVFAEVLIATNFVKEALLIPTQAVVPSLNEQTVYVYKSGKAVRKTVKTGNRTANMVHIIKGLTNGDTLITTGLLQIKEGMDLELQSVK